MAGHEAVCNYRVVDCASLYGQVVDHAADMREEVYRFEIKTLLICTCQFYNCRLPTVVLIEEDRGMLYFPKGN